MLVGCTAVYAGITCGWLYHHAEVTQDGTKVPLRDKLREFAASPGWADLQAGLGALWAEAVRDGPAAVWRRVSAQWPTNKRAGALATLELAEGSDTAQVKKAYRALALRWHPVSGGWRDG